MFKGKTKIVVWLCFVILGIVALLLAVYEHKKEIMKSSYKQDKDLLDNVTEHEITEKTKNKVGFDRLSTQEREEFQKEYNKLLTESVESTNKPYSLYVRIDDQFNKPVPGVSVLVTESSWSAVAAVKQRADKKVRKFVSDNDGFFRLEGKGSYLKIHGFKKNGYVFEKQIGLSLRSDHGKNLPRSNPLIVKAFRVGDLKQEELLIGDETFLFKPNGEMYTIDLLAEAIYEGSREGDLLVKFNCSPDGNGKNPLDWSLELRVPDGGLVETNLALMYEAPAQGYDPVWRLSYDVGNSDFRAHADKKFFIKSRSGQVYGRLKMYIDPYGIRKGDDARINIEYWINEKGSRNLYSKR